MNKGSKKVIFQLENWVWLYLKKRLFTQRMSKLNPTGDGPQVMRRINNNTYKLPFSYNNIPTFIIGDFLLLI